MLKVLHLISSLNTGGAQRMLCKLVARSDRTRFRHVVVSLIEPGPVGKTIADLGIPVHHLDMQRGVPDPRAVIRLRAMLRREVPDVLQTWMYHADLVGFLAAVPLRMPIAWNIRGSLHENPGLAISAVIKLCARVSRFLAVVVTNSDAARVQLTELGYLPKRWVLIPNGFDLAEFIPNSSARQAVRRDLELPAEAVLIGSVARFHPQKDHRTFLKAASLLGRQWPELHFVLVGRDVTPSNTTLQEWIEDEGLGDRVYLLGERTDIPSLTASLDIATCSSAYGEGFPNVIGEAMSCGVPCVVTNVSDLADIVGDTGVVVPPRDAEALAAAWNQLLQLGPERRRELGARARDRVGTHYSLDLVVRQYEELYEQLEGRHPRIVVRPS
jgi:glycosyltransferase involved in cell wall biosynthesis